MTIEDLVLPDLVKEALEVGGFQAIGPISGLPGMVRPVSSGLGKVWDANLDLLYQGLSR